MSDELCMVCRLGKQKQTVATYVQRVGDKLVMLPRVVTWVCDVCGERIYDSVAVLRIQTLVGPSDRSLPERSERDDYDPERTLVERLWASGRRSV